MNKNLFRVIFNPAKGLRQAVQETANACKSVSVSTSSSAAAMALAALAALTPTAIAQIIADPYAPGRYRAPVLLAPNGVQLVNITTPSVAGVSLNVYRQFDIGSQGAILNNSRTNVQTQLGGIVQGNPYLARGLARVIVNQVNSSNPTQLRGFVEAAGQRAEAVIANPPGIVVDDGGFINAARPTLGLPQYNAVGNLEGFPVRGGAVTLTNPTAKAPSA